MTWEQLYARVGRQPLRVTQRHRVRAVIDGRETFLTLRFDERGVPYLNQDTDHTEKARN